MACSIKRIRIEGFRSIDSVEWFPTDLCALVGENSAGKTNLLQALKLVLAKDWHRVTDFAEDDIIDRANDRDVVIEIEFDPAPTHVAFKNTTPVEIPVLRFSLTRYKVNTANAKKGDLRLEGRPLRSDGKPVCVLASPPRRGQKPKFEPLTSIPASLKRQLPVIYVGADRRLREQLPTTRYSLLRRLLENVDEVVKNTKVEGSEETVADRFLQKLDEALQILRVPEFVELEDLVRHHALENLGMDPVADRDQFNLEFGLHDSLEFFKAIRLLVREGEFQLDSTLLGDGAQNAITVAIFQAYERLKRNGAVFLVEEPEMYLHPHRARFFYETLRRISEGNQVIYTTHSPYFVAVPEYEEVRIVRRDGERRTTVHAAALPPTPELREKLRKEFDPERNELFFAKRVILVEGDTEKLAFREYSDRLGLNLNRQGVSIVEVGGKKSLMAFAEVVRSFGIPLTLVFDVDASDFSAKQKGQESEYNQALRDLADASTEVYEFDPDYEAALRAACGEELYLAKCEEYGGSSKAVRARRIAADGATPVPPKVEKLLRSATEGDDK